MKDSKIPSLHSIVVEKHRKGQLSIFINRTLALKSYYRISRNPLVKLFHWFVFVYSFPLTMLLAIIIPVALQAFVYILYYFIGLFLLIPFESYLMKALITRIAIRNKAVFDELFSKGTIKIEPFPQAYVKERL